jgi:cytochrome c oxidase subunit 4
MSDSVQPATTTHSPATQGESSAHDDHDIASHVRVYIGVFIALLIGTIITVAMYFVHFESMAVTVTVALFIATIKALLVAGYFMHLFDEKKMIYTLLTVTMFFFFALGALTIWGTHDLPRDSEMKVFYVS